MSSSIDRSYKELKHENYLVREQIWLAVIDRSYKELKLLSPFHCMGVQQGIDRSYKELKLSRWETIRPEPKGLSRIDRSYKELKHEGGIKWHNI